MEPLLFDLRFALRMLRKSPAFTLTAVLAIMLGTASIATIFSVVNALLIAPSPALGDPGALADVTLRREHGQRESVVSYPLYRDLATQTHALSGLAASAMAQVSVAFDNGGARDMHEARSGMIVSGNYFDVLRVHPAAGRFFRADEDSVPLAKPVVVVSEVLATARYGGPAQAIGRRVEINGTEFTIVGVAPEGFGGTIALIKPDLFAPTMMAGVMRPGSGHLESARDAGWLSMVARVANGYTRGQAQAELTTLLTRIDEEYDSGPADDRITVTRLLPIPVFVRNVVTAFMSVLMAVAALVLLIASLNVANMLLARGIARRKEFTVRLAIGASRRRLVRQVLTESVVLFALGGTAGVLLTAWIVGFAERVHANFDVPVVFHFPIDVRVLAFTLAVSLATGLVFGLIPALAASRRDMASALRSNAAGLGERKQRSRSAFVVVQLAVSVLLLVSAGLFLRALQRASAVDPGFDYQRLAVSSLGLRNAGYDSATVHPFMDRLRERVSALPQVDQVTFSSIQPLSESMRNSAVQVPGRPATPKGSRPDMLAYDIVGRSYFETLRLPIIAGRPLDATDTRGSAPATVVTAAFVRQFLGGIAPARAIGRTFTLEGTTLTIVGVARDARIVSLGREPEPFAFLPDAQHELRDATMLIRVRAGVDPASIGAAVQKIVAALDPRLPRVAIQSLTAASATGLLPQRIAALVTASLGSLGLLLAALGLYGVITYGVGQRVREIGVRMALGATEHRVVRMVVGEAWRLAVAGLAAGLLLATLLSRVLSRFLFGVSPLDPLTLVSVPALLLAVALFASWLPARQAARIDVVKALREG